MTTVRPNPSTRNTTFEAPLSEGERNAMRAYTKKGCAKKFGLWNEVDFGYLAVYVAHAVLDGKLSGKAGQSLVAGRLGKRTVGANNTMPMGPPLVFTRANIDQFRF